MSMLLDLVISIHNNELPETFPLTYGKEVTNTSYYIFTIQSL